MVKHLRSIYYFKHYSKNTIKRKNNLFIFLLRFGFKTVSGQLAFWEK